MKGSIVIMRNMEDVFDFVSRPDNLFDIKRNKWINFDLAGPVTPGSTFNGDFRIGPFAGTMKYEVIIYERPYRLGFRVTSPPALHRRGWRLKRSDSSKVPPMEDIVELNAAAGGTRLTRTFGAKPNLIGGILGLPFAPIANWGMRRDLRRLKGRIEAELP